MFDTNPYYANPLAYQARPEAFVERTDKDLDTFSDYITLSPPTTLYNHPYSFYPEQTLLSSPPQAIPYTRDSNRATHRYHYSINQSPSPSSLSRSSVSTHPSPMSYPSDFGSNQKYVHQIFTAPTFSILKIHTNNGTSRFSQSSNQRNDNQGMDFNSLLRMHMQGAEEGQWRWTCLFVLIVKYLSFFEQALLA
ncbi:hypothetical protein CPB86DRAFT_179889 [Serendipita vermifera]|nr:hypothetical protein CPB86DRAFT_179889 [Serendipita vermifera]